MRLIIGGYAQGRLSYAVRKYAVKPEEIWDAAHRPITAWQGERLIYHAESFVTKWLEEGVDPCNMTQPLLLRWKDCILITQEVGCGLVPITVKDRIWREAVGRWNCLLAAHAQTVDRVCCGLGMRIKG